MKLYNLDGEFIKEVGQQPANFTGIIVYSFGSKHWCFNGKWHRLDGPAIEWSDGIKEWYVDGKKITELQCKLLCDIMKLKGLI